MSRSDRPLLHGIALALAADVAAVGLGVLLFDDLEAYKAAARYTGRVSLALFAAIAVLYAIPARRETARAIVAPFAAAHVFHFGCLAAYLSMTGGWPAPARLAGGALAYAMIVGMPFVQRASGLRERARTIAENVYLAWVGVVFVITYVVRMLGKIPQATGSREEYLGLLAVVVAVLVTHVALRIKSRGAA